MVKQQEKEMKRMGVLRFMLTEMKRFAWDSTTPEADEGHRELQKTSDYLSDIKEAKESSIQAYIDAQASGEQIGYIDSMLDFIGGGKADEDPSSSSSAVRPKGPASAPKHTATPGKPFADKVGEMVKERGEPFTLRSKDFDTPHARVYNGDPNIARLRQEARLVGGQ